MGYAVVANLGLSYRLQLKLVMYIICWLLWETCWLLPTATLYSLSSICWILVVLTTTTAGKTFTVKISWFQVSRTPSRHALFIFEGLIKLATGFYSPKFTAHFDSSARIRLKVGPLCNPYKMKINKLPMRSPVICIILHSLHLYVTMYSNITYILHRKVA